MFGSRQLIGLGFLAGWLVSRGLGAGLPTPPSADTADVRFFEQRIRPVLVQHCYRCHSAESKKPRGGLRVDSRAGLVRGGDSGPAVVPRDPSRSLILKALRHDGPAMPPDRKLPAEAVADFERWIKAGAADPRHGNTTTARTTVDSEAGRSHWAFQPPGRHEPPAVRDATWPRSAIDRFILATLEANKLHPARDADRPTLLRRLTFDLTGLPPTPEEIDAFVGDKRPDALARVVDRLLASPHFGERWGRHWLDVVRYADSSGKGDNLTYHEAWRYRDYVVASFNADKPFDQFIREQVAGDQLPATTQAAHDEQLIATGFLVLGPKALADRDVLQRKMDVVDDQVDTIGHAFLGLTLGCARCHDHKFDPITAADYHALAGILASTRTLDGIKQNNPHVTGWMVRPLGADGERRLSAAREHDKQLHEVCGSMEKVRAELEGMARAPDRRGQETRAERRIADARRRMETLAAEEKRLRATAPPAPPLAMAARDNDKPTDLHIQVRGNPHVLGPQVPRGFPRVLTAGPAARLPADRSGRLELAHWLSDPKNPLTARVMVNRVWQHLLGEGLVATVDNFGVQGARPSHPELLDELAVRFMDEGWSLKTLIRHIVLSRVYGLAVEENREAAAVDPENRFCWQARRRRLEAEAIRDAILAFSGRLDRRLGGSAVASLGESAVSNSNAQGNLPTDDGVRRSIYLPVIRNHLPAVFDVFDFADPDVATGRRDATTVAGQALYLMNSPWVMEQAEAAAVRLLAQAERERLPTLYRRAFGRLPTLAEQRRVDAFLQEASRHGTADVAAWAAVCQAVFGSAEFRFIE